MDGDPRDPLLLRLLPKFVIRNEQGSPYLIRYTLLWTPWFRMYVHHIVRSDGDRELHDHPWDFMSVILSGGYWEHRLPEKTPENSMFKEVDAGATVQWRRGPMSVAFRQAEDMHRVELFKKDGKDVPAWTLVACGRKKREWGFLAPWGWVPWHEYLDQKGRL